MDKNKEKSEKKQYLTIKKEIRKQNKISHVFTLPHDFFKILNCYNHKKLFFNIRVGENLGLYAFLSVKQPVVTAGLIYSSPIKLQYPHKNVKSPKLIIPLVYINYLDMHNITQKNIITITDAPTFINDIEDQKILNLFFE